MNNQNSRKVYIVATCINPNVIHFIKDSFNFGTAKFFEEDDIRRDKGFLRDCNRVFVTDSNITEGMLSVLCEASYKRIPTYLVSMDQHGVISLREFRLEDMRLGPINQLVSA